MEEGVEISTQKLENVPLGEGREDFPPRKLYVVIYGLYFATPVLYNKM